MSRTGFAQRFAQKMGITPLQYMTSWRVQLAREALTDGGVNTLEAAELVGYSSEAAFARVFKKDVGVTPAAYRSSRT